MEGNPPYFLLQEECGVASKKPPRVGPFLISLFKNGPFEAAFIFVSSFPRACFLFRSNFRSFFVQAVSGQMYPIFQSASEGAVTTMCLVRKLCTVVSRCGD
ncbi:MAG: hypothetical protein RLZZ342_583 [Candidatus Parcubacteria bacterium]